MPARISSFSSLKESLPIGKAKSWSLLLRICSARLEKSLKEEPVCMLAKVNPIL